jgi:metal-dependent amidase/aminoacylase/carboxypeptidase family protein
VLQGTFRTFDEQWRFRAHEQIRQVAQGVVQAMGGRLELDIRVGYPVLTNDPALSSRVRTALGEYMGPENVVELDLWPASEDFAYYTQEIPGCFYRLGTANAERGITHGLHTPRFDIDERALSHSPGLMAWLALRELQGA